MKSSITALVLSLAVAAPVTAGDLKDDLVAMEKTAWMAWSGRNGAAMRELITEDAVQAVAGSGVATGRDEIVADVSANTCCEGQKLPAKVYVTSIYVRSDGKWRSTSYQETPL